eukprot:m.22250 g.22250  ORF g.22250 m.22250 type:complete len:184 (-) comp11223_c0_seq1:38-589(-)
MNLRFDLLDILPAVPLSAHAIAAGILVGQAYFQKWTALKLPLTASSKPSSVVVAHRTNGYLTMAAMLTMATSGFVLGRHGRFPGLSYFNFAFAAPWLGMCYQLYRSVQSRDWLYHQLIGNMIVRSCLAVPLARVIGAMLQQHDHVSNATGYYGGIGLASVCIGAWQLNDWKEYLRLQDMQTGR